MERMMENVAANIFPPIELFFLLILLNCIMVLKGFSSSFWYVIQFFLKLLFCIWRIWAHQSQSTKAEFPAKKLCIDRNIDGKLPQEDEMMTEKPEPKSKALGTAKALPLKPCPYKEVDDSDDEEEELTIGELITVMGKLGTLYDPEGDKLQGSFSSNDFAALFEEQEPSLQELEEAFRMFDENNDGFIDAKELRKVVCTLCFTEASEADCKRMIRAYDENGDGRVDFDEFVRLVTKSFC